MKISIVTFLFFLAFIQYTFGQALEFGKLGSGLNIEDRKDPDKSENDKVFVYPIPALTTLMVKSEKYEMLTYSLHDAQGKQIRRLSVDSLLEFEISIDELTAGLYFIKLISVDNFIFTKKIVKL